MQRSSARPDGPYAGEQMKMPVVEHLRELRYRLIVVLLSAAAGAVFGWFAQEPLVELFAVQVGRLVYFTPAELFVTKVRIAVVLGLLVALPVLLVQAWLFVAPALYPHEARLVRRVGPFAYALFLTGLAFGYFVVYPAALRFLVRSSPDGLGPLVSIAKHFELFAAMILPFGFVFQIPLVLYTAARLDLVSPLVLQRRRRHVVFWSVCVAAVITPSDGVTFLMMAVPTIFLFELGLALARRAVRRGEGEV